MIVRSRFVPSAYVEDGQGERMLMVSFWQWITRSRKRFPWLEPPPIPPLPPEAKTSSIEEDISIAIDEMRDRRERIESLLRRAILDDAVLPRHRRRKPRPQRGSRA